MRNDLEATLIAWIRDEERLLHEARGFLSRIQQRAREPSGFPEAVVVEPPPPFELSPRRVKPRHLKTKASHNGKHFQPDPKSTSSRVLAASRRYLESHGRRATFLEIYRSLPEELKRDDNARELARSALIRSGKRMGISYNSSANVELEAA